jgi:hypothetical protein
MVNKIIKEKEFIEDLDPRWMDESTRAIDYSSAGWRSRVKQWYKDHPDQDGTITQEQLRELILKEQQK